MIKKVLVVSILLSFLDITILYHFPNNQLQSLGKQNAAYLLYSVHILSLRNIYAQVISNWVCTDVKILHRVLQYFVANYNFLCFVIDKTFIEASFSTRCAYCKVCQPRISQSFILKVVKAVGEKIKLGHVRVNIV